MVLRARRRVVRARGRLRLEHRRQPARPAHRRLQGRRRRPPRLHAARVASACSATFLGIVVARDPRRRPRRAGRAGRHRRGARRPSPPPTSPTGRSSAPSAPRLVVLGLVDQQRAVRRRLLRARSACSSSGWCWPGPTAPPATPRPTSASATGSWRPFEVPLAGFLIVAGAVLRLLPRAAHRRRSSAPWSSPSSSASPSSPSASCSPPGPKLSPNVVAGVLGRGRARPSSPPASSPPPAASARSSTHAEEHSEEGEGEGTGLAPYVPAGHATPPRPPRSPRERADDRPNPPPLARCARSSRWLLALGGLRRATRRSTRSTRRAPRPRRSTTSSSRCSLIAGVVFVLVEVGVLYLVVALPQAQGRRRQPPAAGPRQHQARDRLDDPPGHPPRRRRRRPRCSPSSTSTTARRTPSEVDGHRPAVVVGVPLRRRRRRRGRHRHRQRPRDPGRRAGRPLASPRATSSTRSGSRAQRQEDAVPGRDAPAARSRPTSPACTAASAPSSAACPTPTCACASSPSRPEDYDAWEANQLEGAEVPERRAGRGGHGARSAPPARSATSSRGEGGNERPRGRHRGRRARVAARRPNLTHFASRGVFAGGIFDLWVDLDGNGEVDIDERGKELNVADLEAWLRNPPGQKPMDPDRAAWHAQPEPHRRADRCPRRLPRDAGVAVAWRSSNDPPTCWPCPRAAPWPRSPARRVRPAAGQDGLAGVGEHRRPQEDRHHVRRLVAVLLRHRRRRGAAHPVQLAAPDQKLLSADLYNQVFTMHGITMIFLVVMPMGAAFMNYLIPLQIGARDVAFPRLNALSFWTLPLRRHLPQHVVVPRRRRRRRLVRLRPEHRRDLLARATAWTSTPSACRSPASPRSSVASTSSSPCSTCGRRA